MEVVVNCIGELTDRYNYRSMATPCSEMTIDLETGSVGIGVFTSLHLPDTNAPIKGINRFERHSIGDVADALVTNYADADCV
ncbi:hypothetical protein, partial [Chamaesiphon sp. OTE_20_metabat_361]|uniref:hypothetical protein n=1 Tax=Chamaesiphon sp. OTE_20_metabat_361 TaxID=2964689 RepID=UPI00286AF206